MKRWKKLMVEKSIQIRALEDPEIEVDEGTGHVQYRGWCRHCVAGRGVGQGPRRRRPRAYCRQRPMDYMFMFRGGVEDERVKPILVMKDERTQSIAATFVDSKGPTPYATELVLQSSCGILGTGKWYSSRLESYPSWP